MDQAEEDRLIGLLIERLGESFPDVPRHVLRQTVDEARGQFRQAPIRDFVPLFVERQSKAKLARLASQTGATR